MQQYILSIDQSTQGTKALLVDLQGNLIARNDVAHRQIVDENGWVSHDPNEIYKNLLESVHGLLARAGIDAGEIACMGISNQRETALAWDRMTGMPACNAIVWQCARSQPICERVLAAGYGEMVLRRTGILVSPFFPASKLTWILENIPEAHALLHQRRLCLGTVDTWLIYKLTGGKEYRTDYSNASRTQLLNLETLNWDSDVCAVFGIDPADLAEICDSDAVFGTTDLEGLLDAPIPICGVLGDSHAALFAQGCHTRGMTKATYGTGSSVMMNVGSAPVFSKHGLVSSLAWRRHGQVQYVLEGNINYTGAVIRWLEKDLGLIAAPEESQRLAEQADPDDRTYLVPAFTGLGAPYWASDARATICGMSRLTRRAELVRAALDSIAYQITDVVRSMEQDAQLRLQTLRVDGGATKNSYLMQFQSDILGVEVSIPSAEELSGLGAAYMAGLACGMLADDVFENLKRQLCRPVMLPLRRNALYRGWLDAIHSVLAEQNHPVA